MGVPKKRTSHSKKRKRRAHWPKERITVVECSHCHEPKLPHRVCLSCGYYRGMEIIAMKKKKK